MSSRMRGEQGIAMVTAMLAIVVVLSLSIAVVGLALYNGSGSSADRKRVQAIAAAEAGIDAYVSAMQTSTGAGTCNTMDANLPTTPPTPTAKPWPRGGGHRRVDLTPFDGG